MTFNSAKRDTLKWFMAIGVSAHFLPVTVWANDVKTRSTNSQIRLEDLFAIGMGTWITFNVGQDLALRNQRTEVLRRFFQRGGQMIDSSPMYGSSEQVLGYALSRLGNLARPFVTTKTWTRSANEARNQFEDSIQYWGNPHIDLLQIHNLLAWQRHLPFLRELKQQGLIRYIGITTSHGRRHEELLKIMAQETIDVIQLTYNIGDREVEKYILPLAQDKGIKVIANRPLQGGRLMKQFQHQSLPEWAKELGCDNWAHYFLRFIISHPAIQFAIPATSKVEHMEENMTSVNQAPLPDSKQRQAMIRYLESL